MKVIEVKDVTTVSGGIVRGKVLLEVDRLGSIAVNKKKEGEGFAYALPRGSYYDKDGNKKWTRPLYPKDAAAIKTAIEAVMNGDTTVGAWYPAKKEDATFMGYAQLNNVQVWVDVAVNGEGRLLMPTSVEMDKEGEKKYSQVLPIKKDDPVRGEILAAMTKAAA